MNNVEYIMLCEKLQRGSKKHAYWQKVVRNQKDVPIRSVWQALPLPMMSKLLGNIRPKKKECYKNALLVAQYLHCDYVEGYVNIGGLPIEHAFNKMNGSYFDVTLELALGDKVDKYEYTSIMELDRERVLDIASELELYGPYASYVYSKQIKL